MSSSKDACTDDFLVAFGSRLAEFIAPGLSKSVVQQAIRQTLEEALTNGGLPAPAVPQATPAPHQTLAVAPQHPPPSPGGRNLELVFVHECRNHGCNVPHCVLCKHNPNKRCQGNFAHKYWVGDKLLAKCEGEIAVELIDSNTGERYTENLSQYSVQLWILDGNKYNTRVREAGEQRVETLIDCEVLRNQKGEPLLTSAAGSNDATQPHLNLKFQPTTCTVPLRELKVTESSESVLAGTKRPPFRLVVRAVMAHDGRSTVIRPAVSEEFVVVTKRTKNLKKQDIPSLDDPISKLNHIGKETVKKLNELKASAEEASLDLPITTDLFRVTKVREFQKLARMSEADGHLQQKLKQLLKLSKEKWDAACEHAKTAVQVDNRMRAWYMPNMSLGLLYNCTLGDIRPDYPVALVANHNRDGADFMEVIPTENQVPAQREQVRTTCAQAVRCWWSDNHEGWMIFTLGNRHFQTLEEIIQYSQSEGAAVAGPPHPSAPEPSHHPYQQGYPPGRSLGPSGMDPGPDPYLAHLHPPQPPFSRYGEPLGGAQGLPDPERPPPGRGLLPSSAAPQYNPFDAMAERPFDQPQPGMGPPPPGDAPGETGRQSPTHSPRGPGMGSNATPPHPSLDMPRPSSSALPSLSLDTLTKFQSMGGSVGPAGYLDAGMTRHGPTERSSRPGDMGGMSHPAKRRREASPLRIPPGSQWSVPTREGPPGVLEGNPRSAGDAGHHQRAPAAVEA